MGEGRAVLYSGMGVGHLILMTQLAVLLHWHGLSVTVVSADPPDKTGSARNLVVPQISKEYQFISFHNLLADIQEDPNRHPMDAIRANNKNLYDLLCSLSSENSIKALVVNVFCTDALDVARQLSIPAYIHFPCSASVLASVQGHGECIP